MQTITDIALRDAFRRWGYLQADLDPLGRLAPLPHPDLDAASGPEAARLRALYCGPIGAEFMHIPDPERTDCIAARLGSDAPPADAARRNILEPIARAELFERFLHARYVGTKRYSLEGSAALVPVLDVVLDASAENGIEMAILAMSHRGRLAVMASVACVPAARIFAGFE